MARNALLAWERRVRAERVRRLAERAGRVADWLGKQVGPTVPFDDAAEVAASLREMAADHEREDG